MCASVRDYPASGKSADALLRLATRIEIPPRGVQVWSACLDAANVESYAGLLSQDELERAARFQSEVDGNRFIVGRALLRALLGRHLGLAPADLRIESAAFGKPTVIDVPSAHFNLGHAGEFALIVIADSCEVGIDLENIDRDVDYDALARRFFSASEYAALQRIPEAQRKHSFLTGWTRKEAVAKALGDGLRALSRIEVTLAPNEPPQVLSVPTGDIDAWTLNDVDAGRDYVASVALRKLAA